MLLLVVSVGSDNDVFAATTAQQTIRHWVMGYGANQAINVNAMQVCDMRTYI